MDLEQLTEMLRQFTRQRDWEQFHSPKNLAMALSAEVGELVEHFQWLTQQESDELPAEKREKIAEEIADVQLYLCLLADRLGIDILEAAEAKLAANAERYTVDRARGNADKQ